MREFATVKEIEDKKILVLPLITMECLRCRTGCIRQGKPFLVKNSAGFDIREGCAVRIGLSRTARAFYGILSFFVPILCAILGYFAAPEIAEKMPIAFLKTLDAQSAHAFFIILFFSISAGIMFLISRSSIHFSTPEIIAMM